MDNKYGEWQKFQCFHSLKNVMGALNIIDVHLNNTVKSTYLAKFCDHAITTYKGGFFQILN